MIHLSKDLELPLDAVTQTFAFLARKGAGKTYGATKLAEEMLAAGAQIIALDPVGVWYGLRIAADGKGRGISIPVFGGLHGDVPLEPGSGALVADLIVDRGISCVLDVSMFRKGERKRFATDFAEQLFHRKKSARTPVHLFIEEAQVFVPQRISTDEARMLGAFEDLVKLGRNFGIGVTLISQRPQAVNKDALSQTECLVVLQTNGALERKAIREWIVEQGLDRDELVDALPSLERGEAYVWSPSWLRLTKRIKIAKKKTFNASATPEMGEQAIVATRELEQGDLEQLRTAMKEVVERAAADDPKALKAIIATLHRQLEIAAAAKPQVERIEVPAVDEASERSAWLVRTVGAKTKTAALLSRREVLTFAAGEGRGLYLQLTCTGKLVNKGFVQVPLAELRALLDPPLPPESKITNERLRYLAIEVCDGEIEVALRELIDARARLATLEKSSG